MNSKTHTVTLPIEDYQELMRSHTEAATKYQELKKGLIALLRRQTFATQRQMTLGEVIRAIEEA